jgi:hypothetical protein
MTSPERPVPKIRWATIQKAADLGERSRLQSLSREELDQELREGGIDPEEADRIVLEALSKTTNGTAPVNEAKLRVVAGGAAGAEKPARRGLGRSRVMWAKVTGWVAATAAAAAMLVRFFMAGPILDSAPAPPHDAVHLRVEAATACSKESWAECEQKLNEARKIDPDGESDPRVIEERKAIAAHLR